MAASDPSPYVATPTGTLQGVAAFSWDGSVWQPSGRAGPAVATPTGVLQGVAPFSWSGSAWTPSGRAQPGVATSSGVLDGAAVYTWSGSAWTPASGTATPSTPSGALRGVAAFSWDGAAWQPAAQARASVPTPYGVLDGVAMFSWTGTTWAAAWAAGQGPSLDLSFMTAGVLDPRIVFSRASVGTYTDINGAIQTLPNDQPRFDYDPVTHALRGLLLEDARTNLLLNTATLGTQSVAVTAQAYMLSFYGTGTITLSGASSGALVGTGATQRVLLTFTPAAGTLTCTVTGSVTNAQLEVGAYATSYVASAGTSGTRQKDSCYIPVDTWYTPASYALAAEFDTALPSGFFCVCGIGDTTVANASYLSNGGLVRQNGGTTAGHSPLIAGAVNKQSGSLTLAALRDCNNAGAIGSATNGQASQTTATRLAIGMSPWALDNMLYGHIRRIRYWPRVLSDAELQAVTT